MQPRPLTETLRGRILGELTRIIRRWVMLSVGVVGVLAVAAGTYDAYTKLQQDAELAATRLRADVDNTARQLLSLADSSLLFTGLTDSYGREGYLKPLLARFNAPGGSPYTVLDYRGRLYVGTATPVLQEVLASPTVREAVQGGTARHGVLGLAGDRRLLVMVVPVSSPQTPAPVGYILASVDPDAALDDLPLRAGLRVALATEGSDAVGPAAAVLPLGMNRTIRAGAAPLEVKVDLRVSRSGASVLLLTLAIALTTGVLGLLLTGQLKGWARGFAQGTTRRLDELVSYCREIVAGRPVTLTAYEVHDEISDVFHALDGMLRQQRLDTEALRASARVFETSAEAILITDAHGHIADINPALLRMTGFTREDLIGRPAGMLYQGADTEATSTRIREALRAGDTWRGETAFRSREGRLIPTYVAVSRLGDDADSNRRTVAVISDISPVKAAEEKLRFLAYHDGLTGLPNFRSLSETLQQRLAAPDAASRPFLVVFFDMDRLKWVNDSHGHDVGDTVIRGLASHLSRRLPARHLLCRRSGDEFVALVEVDGGQTLGNLREQLAEGISSFRVEAEIGSIPVTVSAGVARYPEDAAAVQDLLICADGALNRVKQNGRAAVGWYDEGLGRKLRRDRMIQTRLAHAIDAGAITVHYQPEVDLRHGTVVGFEALARWVDEELGEVLPGEFIPVAEDSHLMERLTLHVLATVHADRPRIEARFPGAQVSVNTRPQALRSRRVLDLLTGVGAPEGQARRPIHIELGEADMHTAQRQLAREMQTLRGLGVRLVLDDFGSGDSSVSRLAAMQGHRIKIDGSLTAALDGSDGLQVVTAMIQLARALDLEVSAEGVESESQRELLLGLGCERAQGWLYARAMRLEELLDLPARLGPVPEAAQDDAAAASQAPAGRLAAVSVPAAGS
ncbi:MAG: putative bifunctional diguanylate cyclase/phosphodiesterase [Rubrivivax sp.]